jgi:Ca2+-binding EF-hand superfamily protein
MAQCKAPDFNFSDAEVSSLFRHVTKAENRVVGVKLNLQQLATKVFEGVKAILIDQVRVALAKAQLSLGQVFTKYDKNKDGFLEPSELQKALVDCHLTLGAKMSDILLNQVLDPPSPARSVGSGKISFGVLQFYLEACGPHSSDSGLAARPHGQIDSGNGATEGSGAAGPSHDALQSCKRAARKILLACHSTLAELVGKLDHLDEGIVNREELRKSLEGQKVGDLDREELAALLKGCDRGQKGYLASSKFLERLYSFAAESESETVLRRLAKTLSHSDTNLQQELQRYDSNGSGKLDKNNFKKALKNLSIALSESEIAKLMPAAGNADIKKFCQQVTEAGRAKPLPSYVLQGAKGGSSAGGRQGSGIGGGMSAYEAEKKYKKNLEALKSEIEEKNREAQGLRKEVKDCHDRYNRLDQDKKNLEARLVDKHSKPPRETANEAQSFN